MFSTNGKHDNIIYIVILRCIRETPNNDIGGALRTSKIGSSRIRKLMYKLVIETNARALLKPFIYFIHTN